MKKFLKLFTVTFIIFFNIVPSSNSEKLFANDSTQIDNFQYCQDKIVIKSVETITIYTKNGPIDVQARIDTGADYSSMDIKLSEELGFKEYIGKINVTSANGTKTRPIVRIPFSIQGKKKTSHFTLIDRSMLTYRVLIGRLDLKDFLVDPSK